MISEVLGVRWLDTAFPSARPGAWICPSASEIQSCVEPQHSKVPPRGVRQLDAAFPSGRPGGFPSFSSSEIQSCVEPQHSKRPPHFKEYATHHQLIS